MAQAALAYDTARCGTGLRQKRHNKNPQGRLKIGTVRHWPTTPRHYPPLKNWHGAALAYYPAALQESTTAAWPRCDPTICVITPFLAASGTEGDVTPFASPPRRVPSDPPTHGSRLPKRRRPAKVFRSRDPGGGLAATACDATTRAGQQPPSYPSCREPFTTPRGRTCARCDDDFVAIAVASHGRRG